MDEARKLKAILYPLSRDVRNLSTFIHNINNVLVAEPQRFAVAAPVGLVALRSSVRTLSKSTRVMKDTTDITLQQSAVAADLAQATQIAFLRPAVQLNVLAMNIKAQIDRASNSVLRIEGYLNPVFVFMAAMLPVVENFMGDVDLVDDRIQQIKKSLSRVADQESIAGLGQDVERHLALLVPQFAVIQQEIADISAQMGLLMGRMNRLQELSSRLEVLVRMGVALDGAVQDLIPTLSMLKKLGALLADVQKVHDPTSLTLGDHITAALASLELPSDSLLQLELRMAQQMERYVDPIVMPLQEVAETLRAKVPTTHDLNGLESAVVNYHHRMSNLSRLLSRLFEQLGEVIVEANQSAPLL